MYRNNGPHVYAMQQTPEQRQAQELTLRQRFYWLIVISDHEPMAATSVLALSGVAAALLWYPAAFEVSPGNFAIMASWGNQYAWGRFALLLIGYYAVAVLRRWRLMEALALFFIHLWWVFMAGLFVLSAGTNVTANVFIALAVQSLWVFWRFIGRGYLSPYGVMFFRRSRVE